MELTRTIVLNLTDLSVSALFDVRGKIGMSFVIYLT